MNHRVGDGIDGQVKEAWVLLDGRSAICTPAVATHNEALQTTSAMKL